MTDWDGMSEEEIAARLDQALTRLRALAEAEEVVNLEEQAILSPDFTWPPSPSTAHPALEQHAEFVRQWGFARGEQAICLPGPRKPVYRFITEPETEPTIAPSNSILLVVQRVYRPAPYVGRPFVYGWLVAADRYQRWIADDTVQIIHWPGRD